MNVSEIHRREKKRQDVRKATYREIYDQATRKVSRAVDVGAHYAMFEIPSFVMGLPSFDRGKALSYIMRQFENGGFDVSHGNGWEIVISWRKSRTRSAPMQGDVQVRVNDDETTDFSSFINLRKTAERLKHRK